MTRIAVLADIHGILPALEAVIDDMAQFEPEQVIVAGDLINWGPSSPAVLERVTAEGWAVIRGNNEYYPLDYHTNRAPAEWNNYTLIPIIRQQLGSRWLKRLAVWPDTLCLRFDDAPLLRVYHGSPRDPWEGIYDIMSDEEISTILASVEESTVVVGHTHLPMDRQVERWHILNPGSVGLPIDGQFTGSYMLLDGDPDGWQATLRRIEFDRAPVLDEYKQLGFDERCGITERLVIEEVKTARIYVLAFASWRAATCPHLSESDAFARFTEADRWAYTPQPYLINME